MFLKIRGNYRVKKYIFKVTLPYATKKFKICLNTWLKKRAIKETKEIRNLQKDGSKKKILWEEPAEVC